MDKKTGKKMRVQTNKDGKQFILDEHGQVVMINDNDKPKIQTDS